MAQDVQSHVGTVVGHALQIDQQLQELGAQLDGALTGLKALHMAVFQGGGDQIYNLLQRLHLDSQGALAALVAGYRLVQRLSPTAAVSLSSSARAWGEKVMFRSWRTTALSETLTA